jgi:hypothetical protein
MSKNGNCRDRGSKLAELITGAMLPANKGIHRRQRLKRKRPPVLRGRFLFRHLLAKAELRDERQIALLINLLQIAEQRTAGVDQSQQAATRMVILRVRLEVLGQVDDALSQDRDLNFGGSRVAFGAGVFLDEFSFALSGNWSYTGVLTNR